MATRATGWALDRLRFGGNGEASLPCRGWTNAQSRRSTDIRADPPDADGEYAIYNGNHSVKLGAKRD